MWRNINKTSAGPGHWPIRQWPRSPKLRLWGRGVGEGGKKMPIPKTKMRKRKQASSTPKKQSRTESKKT